MGGFSNITSDESIVYADNASFDGTERGGKMTTNGQLWIGATASPHVRLGNITSTGGTVSVSNGAGSINLEAGATVPTTVTTDSGVATPAGNNLNVVGGTGIDTSGSGSTVTIAFDVTEVPTIATSYASDSGSAVPALNVLTIAGGPGVTTSASGSTVTINSVVFTNQAGNTSVTSDSGSFATAAITLTLPAVPAQGEVVEFACITANALIIDAPSTHLIRIGSLVSSAGGTATSTAIGDAVVLRYYAAATTWVATSVVGTWVMA